VAHFHYVMMGGTVMGLLAGLHYWWPKMFGRMYPELWGKISCAFIFVGFNVTFLSQFILGKLGMPRRYHDYFPEYAGWNMVSSIGSLFIGIGFLIMFIYLFWSLKRGAKAPANPWDGKTLEWQISSPPIEHNFTKVPAIPASPYEYGVKG